jgi:hypothetical protein
VTRPDVFAPSAVLLAKLGSIAVHAEEMLSSSGHTFDQVALKTLLDDAEVKAWIEEMDRLAMVPKKR